MRKQLLEVGYGAGRVAVLKMRKQHVPFVQIQKSLFPSEKETLENVKALYNPKCYDTMRTFMRWYQRGFERAVADAIHEGR